MKNYRKTSDGKKGGLFVGKSHEKGGIPAIVVDTGQPIEVEGGEAIINKEATKKYWKELSKINQSAGNGNPIPPPQGFSDEVSQYSNGGKISKLAITEGTKHELEHSDTIAKFKKQGVSDKEVARKIALDHLKENPNYYKVLKKLKLKKGGEIVCRSCGWSWLESENPKGENLYKCHKCNSDNKNFYKTGGAVENKKEVYDEWKTLVNMSASELKEFLKTEDGKKAGLTKEKADELGIGSGHESASWILKMKAVPYTEWSDTMWSWAKRQIGFIKRMSGNKGGLYEDNGNKTRKHTSLLIWGHNPEKFNGGGLIAPNGKPSNLTPEQYKLVRTPEFKAWFGDWENDPENASKVVDENGEPQSMFHQTSFETKNKLYSKGLFELGFESASKSDKETPYGFFFKKNNRDIGLRGKEQVNVFLKAKNPLIFTTRNWINSFFNDTINGFFENNLEYQKTDEKYKNQWDFLWEEAKNIGFEDKENLKKWDNETKELLEEWRDKIDKISIEQKILLTNYFKNSEYDAMIIEFDEGSFGRKTDTTIVFNQNQIKLADGSNSTFDGNNPDIRFGGGGRTIAQTPAPKKDRIVGSEKNAPKSSESSKSAEKIVLSEQVLESIETILREYNKNTSKKVDLNTAKAVVRRGMGAYSSSHRPTISGGKPNSRVAWGLARLKAFLYKIENGKSKSGKYSQDNDLIDDLGYEHEKFDNGGMTEDEGQLKVGDKVVEFKRPTPNQEKREYKTKGEIVSIVGAMAKVIFEPNNLEEWVAIRDLKKIQEKFAKGNKIKAENKGGNCYEMAGKLAMGIMFADKDISYPDFKGTPYVVHAEVSGQGAISGLRYGHAWVEDDMFIYDFSNGRKIVFPKELYYAIGNVITKPPKYYKYTFDEARKKMSETGHYGSWELKTESGL